MDLFLIDLRQAFRIWSRNPVVAVATVLTLALGIGVPATMYSIVRGTLRSLPVERGEDIMALERIDVRRGATGQGVTPHDFLDWRAQQTAFENLAAYHHDRLNLSDGTAPPERIAATAITPNAFSILGVSAVLGRTLVDADAEPAAPNVAVISQALWQRRFGGDTSAVGHTIRLNGTPHVIVGIMPPRFSFPARDYVWTPLAVVDPAPRADRGDLTVFGRLVRGTDLTSARAEFDAIAERLARAYPETNADVRAWIVPFTEERYGPEMGRILYTMLAVVSTVLLIACANVANLLTAQAVHRRRELAIRSALGADRARLLRQFVIHTGTVAGIGAVVGIGIAWLGTHLFNRGTVDMASVYWIDVKVDWATLAFVVTAAIVACALSAIIPVRQAWRSDVQLALQREGRGASGFRVGRLNGSLVVAQVAFSCVLLAVAGLMIKGLNRLGHLDYPFAADRILVGEIEFTSALQEDVEGRLRLTNALRERLEAEPGVRAVTFASSPPGQSNDPLPIAIGSELASPEEPSRHARRIVITPDYFAGLGSAVQEGRAFGGGDAAGAEPVAVVNRSFADRFFPNASPVGARLRFGPDDWGLDPRTIVGVVPDLLVENVSEGQAGPEGVYVPMTQAEQSAAYMLIHTRGDPGPLLPALRAAVVEVDPDLPWADAQRLDRAVADSVQTFRTFGRLFVAFGLGALFLSSVGLHGITSFVVGQRLREIGIRVALGATPRDVARLVLEGTLRMLGTGAFFGIGLTMLVTPVFREGFLGVGARDPAVLGGIVVTLAAVALIAAAGPLGRARRVQPMAVLKT